MQRPLDLLVNNAGRFLDVPFRTTEDGFEQAKKQDGSCASVHTQQQVTRVSSSPIAGTAAARVQQGNCVDFQ